MSKVHSSVNDVLTIGSLVITGNPETGERLSIAFDDDQVETLNGTGGEDAYSVTRSSRATITITLMKSSRKNRQLLLADRAAKLAGTLLGPIVYTDGSSKWIAATGLMSKVPDYSVTDGGDQSVQWVVKCSRMIGGPEGLDAADVINPADYGGA